MRPVRLTVQAFGPYGGCEVIDFREAAGAGLFGIYGQTGSGKSTIFSAMTFALFGEPAKAEQEAPSLRSDHADAGLPTEVELVFDVGAKRYVALRRPVQMRPRQRGGGETRDLHVAFLFDATGMALETITEKQRGKVVAERRVGEVDAAIAEILGYGASQFRQIVLLPQGRFETFLSAKTKERLEILRELFDVSIYGSLMADLKERADAAEKHVREERELCARQLAMEGFESTAVLHAGIEEAEARHAGTVGDERREREACAASLAALREAEAIEAKFVEAEKARSELMALQAREARVDALAARVARADKARTLVDADRYAAEARRDAAEAAGKLDVAREASVLAAARAKAAAELLAAEMARAGEVDACRRMLDEMERFRLIIEKAADIAAKVADAEHAERRAALDLGAAQHRLTEMLGLRRARDGALKSARESETRRKDLIAGLVALDHALDAAKAFEKAAFDAQSARIAFEMQATGKASAEKRALAARAALEEAEQRLTTAQALHLASRLEPGVPCPVCGSASHPAPATGTDENAGLDRAYREARSTVDAAEAALRSAAGKFAAAEATLAALDDRVATLDQPSESSRRLAETIAGERRALEALGPAIDMAAAGAEIERLSADSVALEHSRDASRDALAARRQELAGVTARRDEMLSAVPEPMRHPHALAVAKAAASRTLDALQTTLRAAEMADRQAREAAIGAERDRDAAAQALMLCQVRQLKAGEAFDTRLAETGLTEAEFRHLAPAIATIETDRETVEAFRRMHALAADAVVRAEEAIAASVRPELELLRQSHHAAERRLADASENRVRAESRVAQLIQLRDRLADTLRKVDEAEAEAGPLRSLAALVNGRNLHNLDLETFAIGAMFDQVLEAANLRLHPMTNGRYRMERDVEGAGRGRRGLGIQVSDIFTGKARPTSTLSGGETFIAALALALGLADVVERASGKIRLDTIFIDEGFGSLDTENGAGTLDQVLQVLNTLVSQNRAVGIISHVPLVQEAIPNGFYVRKRLTGSSVETRGVV